MNFDDILICTDDFETESGGRFQLIGIDDFEFESWRAFRSFGFTGSGARVLFLDVPLIPLRY